MIRDTSLIMQIQLAIMGIVLVGGLFYLWRSCCRMEEKIDVLAAQVQSVACICPVSKKETASVNPEDAEEFMKKVFGSDDASDPAFMMFASAPPEEPANKPIIEEIVDEDHESEAETDTSNPLSKSKLKRMNVDTLKEMCLERGLSTEGSKNVLMNRLLGLERD